MGGGGPEEAAGGSEKERGWQQDEQQSDFTAISEHLQQVFDFSFIFRVNFLEWNAICPQIDSQVQPNMDRICPGTRCGHLGMAKCNFRQYPAPNRSSAWKCLLLLVLMAPVTTTARRERS